MTDLLAVNWNTVIQYGIYAAVIVVCIVLLVLIKKFNRLPRHPDFKKRLEELLEDIKTLKKEPEEGSKYDFFKQAARTLYKADKLQYTATMMAEKERDGDISRVAAALEGARSELVPYKYSGRDRSDPEGLDDAAEKVASAIATMELVIARDGALKARRSKK